MLDVIYDARCPLCRRTVALLRRLDWRRRLRFHDANDRDRVQAAFPPLAGADLDAAIHVVTDGRVGRGFHAARAIAWRLPPAWPIAPLLHLPGMNRLGPRLYAWIARNRHRLLPLLGMMAGSAA